MIVTELNPKGNFSNWNKEKLEEIKSDHFSEEIGRVLYENDELKLTEIILKPQERIPFRRHRHDYHCICTTGGLLVSRNVNGKIGLIRLEEKDSFFWKCSTEEMIHDLENIGEQTVIIKILILTD